MRTKGAFEARPIAIDGRWVQLIGIIIGLDENDILTIDTQFGSMLIGSTGTPPFNFTGKMASINIDDLDFYPSGM